MKFCGIGLHVTLSSRPAPDSDSYKHLMVLSTRPPFRRSCVINLSPEKARCLAEVYRVLAPGGEMFFSGETRCGGAAAVGR